MTGAPGDLPVDELRSALHRTADLIADYIGNVGEYPVLPPVSPGAVSEHLPEEAPEHGVPLETLLDDYKSLIEPNVTHWNHPGFLAYFAITGSAPGIVGETLAAALNVNAMLWRTSPAATELEERCCDWVRRLVGLPDEFTGHINDTASMSSLLALAVARHRVDGAIREQGLAGRDDLGRLVLYSSDQAHSSIAKAVMALGVGNANLRRVPSDEQFRMKAPALATAVAEDRASGLVPFAAVATVGTTSTSSADPVAEIAEICERARLWLHVDAAYAGGAAICDGYRELFRGWERADSIVLNPHKWLFTPVDCSLLYVRDTDELKATFSLVPEYLKSGDPAATNLMDYGVQLGRRFRALKLWMVIRAFGAEGLRERIRFHCGLAKRLASWIEDDPLFELAAPVPFSLVCFRARLGSDESERNLLNEKLLERVNREGPVLLSHTRLGGRFVLRAAIGNLRTGEDTLRTAWNLLRKHAGDLR